MVGGGGYSGHEHKSSGTAGLSERRDVCLFIEKLVNEEEEIVALAFIFQNCWNQRIEKRGNLLNSRVDQL